ncbi:MAG: PilZ domain-containing protein [Thermoanaerobaculia bacterium]
MESEDQIAGEFQRSTRMPLDAVVRLHFQGTVAYQNGFAANVSATGMFVKHPSPPPLGTQLVFEFNLGAERKPVQGAGEVVWVRDRYLGPGQPAGVGIRFLQLDTQSRDHIAEALFEYLEQSLAEDSLLDSSGFTYVADASQLPPVDRGRAAQSPLHRPEAMAESAPGPAAESAAESNEDALSETLTSPGAARVARRDEMAAPAPGDSFAPPSDPRDTSPLDFDALQGLPPQPEADPYLAETRPFSVFSPLDEADPQTADIVRAALREEPALPMLASAAAKSSERESAPWVKIALVLALFGGGSYLAWMRWGAELLGESAKPAQAVVAAPAPQTAPPARVPASEPLTAAPAPGTTLVQQVGVDPTAVSAAAKPPRAGATSPPPEDSSAEASDVAAAATGSTGPANTVNTANAANTVSDIPPSSAPVPPTPAAAAVPAPAAPAPRPAATPSTGMAPVAAPARPARTLNGIRWSDAPGGTGETAMVLTGDGGFSSGAFSYSEIGGDNPRVLIKLKGMENPYRGAAPRGSGALVKGVRTGFHVTTNGNEIHVVIDLARTGIQVASLTPGGADGNSLTLTLSPP